jgi:hypothetical protein
MNSSMHARRPFGVTLLMALGVIGGILNIVGGIFVIVDSEDQKLIDAAKMTKDELTGAGVGMIIGGTVLLVLAILLGKGSNVVRWIYGIVAALNAGVALYAIISFHSEQRFAGALSLAMNLFVLWILFSEHGSREFFEGD